ncbi:MAG TPA: GntR family transcriptional regulator [Anaerolineaceae bacterium]|nr:GntR family transcriptional regulator [Anaerolineaceae bacterium]
MEKPSQESPHPFIRLQRELAALIEQTPPGQRLSSEPQLARQLGVSRATLREGMRTFEAQGLIRRRQGVGTFVVPRVGVIESGLEVLESIETQARRIGLAVFMGDLEVSEIEAGLEEVQNLHVPLNSQLVRVARVIYTEQHPVAYLVDTLPPDVLSEQELQQGFTGSVLDFLINRGTPILSQSYTDIQAVAAEARIARRMEIQRGDVLLNFEARLFDSQEKIIDYSLSYFLPGFFRFHVVRHIGSASSYPDRI